MVLSVCVVGSGSIGSYVGGLLAAGGADVSLFTKSSRLESFVKEAGGLRVSDLDHKADEFIPAARLNFFHSDLASNFAAQDALKRADIVLISLKAVNNDAVN